MVALKPGGAVDALIVHEEGAGALGTTEAAVDVIQLVELVFGDVDRAVVKIAGAVEACRFLVADVVDVEIVGQFFQFAPNALHATVLALRGRAIVAVIIIGLGWIVVVIIIVIVGTKVIM